MATTRIPVPITPVVNVDSLYTLYYFQYDFDYKFPGESHPFWEAVYVNKGSIMGLNGTEPYELHEGQLIFHQPNVFHSVRGNGKDPFDMMVISFQCEKMPLTCFGGYIYDLAVNEKILWHKIFEEGYHVHHKPIGTNLIYQPAKDGEFPKEDVFGSLHMIKLLLEQFFILLYRKKANSLGDVEKISVRMMIPEYRLVNKISSYLEENIFKRIVFNDIVSQFNISGTQLKTLFKQVTGYGIMEYYRIIIIEKIKYYIQTSDLNFTEIADLFNFSTVHYFSKFFSRETGQTPSQYAKTLNINGKKTE